MAKILIAVPTFETIYPDTFQSIYRLDKGGNETDFEFVRGYDVATARNRIAERTIDANADYVLMVDNDVVLPENALKLLMEESKDVCLGFYAHRGPNNRYGGNTCLCKLKNDHGETYYHYPLESEYTAQEIQTLAEHGETKIIVHGGGMGCALIRTDVFRRASYPWYDWVNYGDSNRGMLSEDLYFCELCRNSHIDIWADVRVKCGHMFRHMQWPEPID